MVTTEIKNSLRQSLAELTIAENELNRPFEDVVTLALCLTARRSMNTLLQNYLKSKEIAHDKEKSLHDLLSLCRASDKQFDNIDLSKILCNSLNHAQCEDKHCLTYNNVEECISVAKTIKHTVLQQLNLNESDLAL